MPSPLLHLSVYTPPYLDILMLSGLRAAALAALSAFGIVTKAFPKGCTGSVNVQEASETLCEQFYEPDSHVYHQYVLLKSMSLILPEQSGFSIPHVAESA